MKFADFGEFLSGGGHVAHRLMKLPEAEVGVGLGGIELDRLFEGRKGFGVALLLRQNGTQIDVGDANVIALLGDLLKERESFIRLVVFEGDVREIGERLRVSRIDCRLRVRRSFGCPILRPLRLPVRESNQFL